MARREGASRFSLRRRKENLNHLLYGNAQPVRLTYRNTNKNKLSKQKRRINFRIFLRKNWRRSSLHLFVTVTCPNSFDFRNYRRARRETRTHSEKESGGGRCNDFDWARHTDDGRVRVLHISGRIFPRSAILVPGRRLGC